MASKPRKALIGGFVVGGVALVAVAVTVLGSGKLLQHRPTCVMFFSGSIMGLSVGSPVEFRGVKVGEVTKIAAVFDPGDVSITIPVYVEFDPRSLILSEKGRQTIPDTPALFNNDEIYRPLLDKGLRAQLDIQSIITRQLYVSLDFHPELPAKLVGLERRFPEIPTIPSLQEQLLATLQKLPDKLMRTTDGIDRLVNSPATQDATRELVGAIRDLDALVRDVRTEVKPLAASFRGSSDAARRAFAQAERTVSLKEGPSAELAASLTAMAKKAAASLDQMRSTLASYQAVAAQNEHLGYDVSRTLGELDAAARSVHSLADYLELHPESVLKGRR